MLGVAAAAIVGALFLVQALGGSAEPGRIIDSVRNERTQGLAVRPEVGQLAPNFEAQDLDGNIVRLSDFQGKPVILNFWATWCTSCRAEIPALQRVFQERQHDGLAVIGVDWGEGRVSAARSYMDDLGATYTVAMDPSGSIGDRYRVQGLPVTLAIDKDGVIQELVGGELTYRAFDRFAQLAMGEVEEVGEEIGPVRDIQTQDGSGG
jgi:peroxiredoxin